MIHGSSKVVIVEFGGPNLHRESMPCIGRNLVQRNHAGNAKCPCCGKEEDPDHSSNDEMRL